MDDITSDLAVDGVTLFDQEFLNKNIRDALQLILSEPTCLVLKTSTQTIAASAAWTAISWDDPALADTEDPATPIYDSAAPTRLTCQTAGWYELCALFPLAPPTVSNTFSIAFRVNGSSSLIYAGDSTPAGNAAQNKIGCFSTIILLAESDYIELIVRTSYGSTQTSMVLWGSPRVSFRRVRGT